MNRTTLPFLAAAVLALAACGGGSDELDSFDPDGFVDTETETEAETGVPGLVNSFVRVCERQEGFAGVTAFDADASGVRTVAMFRGGTTEGTFYGSSSDVPASWAYTFDDERTLDVVQLVSCLELTGTTPTGVNCDFDGDDGTSTLELADASYTVTVYESATGALVGTSDIDAVHNGCPIFARFEPGQTELDAVVSNDQLTVALRPFVSPDGSTTDPNELPQFNNDFKRLCGSQIGFSGQATYDGAPGIHPVSLFEVIDSGNLIQSTVDLPAGWQVEEDDDSDDSSDLAQVQLVACSAPATQTPNGIQCELEATDGGENSVLELVDSTYEVAVYSAANGEVVGSSSIDVVLTDCPGFLFVEEGQTTLSDTPSAEQYTDALAAFVNPS